MIKSAVDDLKKSGAPMRLTLPPGGGGPPFSPSPYVFVLCRKTKSIVFLSKVTYLIISRFCYWLISIRLSVPLSPTENGGLKSSIGETTTALKTKNTVYHYYRTTEACSPSLDQDKDSLNDKPTDPRHRLIDFMSDKGFDLIGHSNSDQEKVAHSALDNGD